MKNFDLAEIEKQAREIAEELVEKSGLEAGQILVVGCSTSEVCGDVIGKASVPEAAEALMRGLYPVVKQKGIYLAAQCCEHLNRALIVERECAEKYFLPEVWVKPAPKAGGSFATAAYAAFEFPVAVEAITAHAGIDIGGTLIGMHLRRVAVPLRLSKDAIGNAHIICAYTRPKYIGGPRAKYE